MASVAALALLGGAAATPAIAAEPAPVEMTVSVRGIDDHSASISWREVADASTYEVVIPGVDDWDIMVFENSANISGLTGNTSYVATVRAIGGTGAVLGEGTVAFTTPHRVVLTATAIDATTVRLEWQADGPNAGPVTLERWIDLRDPETRIELTGVDIDAGEFLDQTVVPQSNDYVYELSWPSGYAVRDQVGLVAGVITPTATAVTTTTATIAWPAVDGGPHGPVTYTVSVEGGTPVTTSDPSIGLTGLTPDTTHLARVQAIVSAGGADAVIAAGSVDVTTNPLHPISAVPTPGGIQVSWDPLPADAILVADGHDVPVSAGSTGWLHAAAVVGTHTFQLVGEEFESELLTVDVPERVLDIVVSGRTTTTALLAWTLPEIERASLTYLVFLDGATIATQTTDPSMLLTGLQPGTHHHVRVEVQIPTKGEPIHLGAGTVEFDTLAMPTPAPVVPNRPASTLPTRIASGMPLAKTGADPVPLIVVAAVLLTGGVLAAVGASVRPARAAARNRGPRG